MLIFIEIQALKQQMEDRLYKSATFRSLQAEALLAVNQLIDMIPVDDEG